MEFLYRYRSKHEEYNFNNNSDPTRGLIKFLRLNYFFGSFFLMAILSIYESLF
jgi:hypothetical protein